MSAFAKVRNWSWSIPVAGLLLGGVVLVGCKDDETKPPPAPPMPIPSLPPTTKPTDLTPPPAPKPPEVPTIPSTPPATGPAADTGTPAVPAAGDADTEAKSLISKAQAAVADKKWEDAEAILKQLEGLEGKLSPDLQKQVEALKQAVTAGKGLGGVKLPGLPEVK